MKKIVSLFSLLFLLATVNSLAQTHGSVNNGLVWHTSLQKADSLSKLSNKPIFAFFTGSDWCGWCHKLQRDVFAKPEFIAWAKKNVILLELDFPRTKQLSPELMQQNNSLQQAFGISGYPTIWLFFMGKDETTQQKTLAGLGSLGYPEGAQPGKEEVKFLANANLILQNKAAK